MIRSILLFCFLVLIHFSFGQTSENDKIIELGKAYKDFMFRNDPNKEIIKDLKKNVPGSLDAASAFIVQTISRNNKLLSKDHLMLPDSGTIKTIYIIRAINLNLREESQIENGKLIDSLKNNDIPRLELIDNYYDMLFTSVGNKEPEFDLSKENFNLKEFNLRDDTEKGIFFLQCMRLCNAVIWGYMNIVKPPNTKKAYEYIKRFPRFNGQPYFQYNDLYFPDFQMVIFKKDGVQSYKSYYLDKYYELLINHLICMQKENASEKERYDLVLGSIIKESNLYKYTKLKPTLEEILKAQKKE